MGRGIEDNYVNETVSGWWPTNTLYSFQQDDRGCVQLLEVPFGLDPTPAARLTKHDQLMQPPWGPKPRITEHISMIDTTRLRNLFRPVLRFLFADDSDTKFYLVSKFVGLSYSISCPLQSRTRDARFSALSFYSLSFVRISPSSFRQFKVSSLVSVW